MTTPTPTAANDIEVTDTPYQALKNGATNNMSGEIRLSKCQWATVCKIMQAKFEDLPDTLSGVDLKRLRMKSGLTQQALAEELKVAISTIRQWERGVGDEVGEEIEPQATTPTFADLIKRQGLSVSGIAKEMNLGRHTVGNWIGGRGLPHLSPSQTLKLIRLLDCSLEELVASFGENFS